MPGNVETTLATIRAAEGLPLHLTHIQFHSYATEGDRQFSSGARADRRAMNEYPNISIDVGQVMFGQTCTASGDSMRQYRNAKNADPKQWVVMDIECDAGCGVVPVPLPRQELRQRAAVGDRPRDCSCCARIRGASS